MSTPPRESSPAELVRDQPRIMRALRRAAAEAMRKHRQAGVPIATWENGKVVWIAPEDIPIIDPEEDDQVPDQT